MDQRPSPGHVASAQDPDTVWRRVEHLPAFGDLLARKRRFIVPAVVFFVIYYFALPVLVGYFPGLMEQRVVGAINLAYLFALSQFVMAWALMWLYLRQARRYDAMASDIRRQAGDHHT